MRLRPIEQMSPGVVTIVGDADPVLTELLNEKIDRVRFQMWNGPLAGRPGPFGSDLPDYEEVSEFVVQYPCRTNTQVSEAHAGSARLFVPQSVHVKGTTLRTGGTATGYPALWPNLQ
jgi:hypothetical protein